MKQEQPATHGSRHLLSKKAFLGNTNAQRGPGKRERDRAEESIAGVRKCNHADALYTMHKQHKRSRQGRVIFKVVLDAYASLAHAMGT